MVSRGDLSLGHGVGASFEAVDIDPTVSARGDHTVGMQVAGSIDVSHRLTRGLVGNRELGAFQCCRAAVRLLAQLLEAKAVGLVPRVVLISIDCFVLIGVGREGAVSLVPDLAGYQIDLLNRGVVVDFYRLAGMSKDVLFGECHCVGVICIGDERVIGVYGQCVTAAICHDKGRCVYRKALIGDVGDGVDGVGGIGGVAGHGAGDDKLGRIAHRVRVGGLSGSVIRSDDLLGGSRDVLHLYSGLCQSARYVFAVLDIGRGIDEQRLVDLGVTAIGGDGNQVVARVKRRGCLAICACRDVC